MFQVYAPNQKVTFLNFFINAMIRNIKIYIFINIIGFSKSMEPNNFIH
jgi:hypothetical protein